MLFFCRTINKDDLISCRFTFIIIIIVVVVNMVRGGGGGWDDEDCRAFSILLAMSIKLCLTITVLIVTMMSTIPKVAYQSAFFIILDVILLLSLIEKWPGLIRFTRFLMIGVMSILVFLMIWSLIVVFERLFRSSSSTITDQTNAIAVFQLSSGFFIIDAALICLMGRYQQSITDFNHFPVNYGWPTTPVQV